MGRLGMTAGLALALVALAGCTPNGGLYIPYYTSATTALQFQPAVVPDRSTLLAPGRSAVALRLIGPNDTPIIDGRVKVRFLRVIGQTHALGEDVWANWQPDAAGGGVWVAETTFDKPGLWRADVLALTAAGRRGEAETWFTVPPAS